MQEYTLYIGRYDKDTKELKSSYAIYMDIIEYTLNRYNINCFTAINSQGIYKHNNGITIKEPTIIIKIVADFIMSVTVTSIKKELCTLLNQEDILITKQEIAVL